MQDRTELDTDEHVSQPPDHGITIESVRLTAGNPLRAVCLCGWVSDIVPARPHAVREGTLHMIAADAESAARALKMSDSSRLLAGAASTDERRPRAEELEGRAPAVAVALPAPMIEGEAAMTNTATEAASEAEAQPWSPTIEDAPVPAPSDIEGNLYVELGVRDPYIDECPGWCQGRHTVRAHEDDRRHFGSGFFVPIRSLPTTYSTEDKSIGFTDICISLERPALYRDPFVRFQVLTPDGLMLPLTVEEAQQIADCLLALVKESQMPSGQIEGAA